MGRPLLLLHAFSLLLLLSSVSFNYSVQLQPSQTQSLFNIEKLLNYNFSGTTSFTDYCSIEPTESVTIVCYEGNITQFHISGDSNGIPQLSQDFSTESLFASLANFSTLKVLSLVSLDLWGPLPASIGQLTSLEILNVSANYFSGEIPVRLSNAKNLHTLVLDHNKLSGEVPGWLGSLSGLTVLSLRNNSFFGCLPKSLTRLENLRVLSVSKNRMYGEVPDLQMLTNLQVLDLQDNHFGPNFPVLHNSLVTLVLRNNSFRDSIPGELVSYYQLQKLDISLNGFVGPFLPSLLSLPSINYLDISRNKFTGMMFENMSCNADLAYVDISANLLNGNLPSCLKSRLENKVVLYANNCLANKEQKQHPSTFCHQEALAVEILPRDEEKHKIPHHNPMLASSTVGVTIAGIIVVSLVVLVVRKRYHKDPTSNRKMRLITEKTLPVNTVKLLSDARYISQTMKLGATLPTYRTFSLEELKEATNNFNTSNLLSEGPQNQCQVYKGKLTDGTLVAVRSLNVKKKHNHQALMQQIELISKLRHSHLVSALGHCINCCLDDSNVSKIFLVFEFVPNGTLRHHVTGVSSKRLTWRQRIGSSIGIARGLQFLHSRMVPGLFSNNPKTTNVLLDHDLQVKLSSYNLPSLAEKRETVGLLFSSSESKPNTYTRGNHDDKEDVYDLGVILLEIIVGRPIKSNSEVLAMKDLVQVSTTSDDTARRNTVDPEVQDECSEESLKIMMEICVRCLSNDPSIRPSIEDAIWNLQFAAQVQDSGTIEPMNIA